MEHLTTSKVESLTRENLTNMEGTYAFSSNVTLGYLMKKIKRYKIKHEIDYKNKTISLN